jgi:hypothetical protein
MSEPSRPAPSSAPGTPSKYIDIFLYFSAAVSYITLSIYNKWLLDWIVGPFWLVAWVWGLPALVKLVRRQPIRPQRGQLSGTFDDPHGDPSGDDE